MLRSPNCYVFLHFFVYPNSFSPNFCVPKIVTIKGVGTVLYFIPYAFSLFAVFGMSSFWGQNFGLNWAKIWKKWNKCRKSSNGCQNFFFRWSHIFDGKGQKIYKKRIELVGVSGDHLTSRNGAQNLLNGNQPKIDIEITSIDVFVAKNGNIYIIRRPHFLRPTTFNIFIFFCSDSEFCFCGWKSPAEAIQVHIISCSKNN